VRLNQDHALLFAEPVVGTHTANRPTAADGAIQPFTQLDETKQVALLRQTVNLSHRDPGAELDTDRQYAVESAANR
jgi:hypothetical protein